MSTKIFMRPNQLIDYLISTKQTSSKDIVVHLDKILSRIHPNVAKQVDHIKFSYSLVGQLAKLGYKKSILGMKYTDDLEMHPDRLKSLINHSKRISNIQEGERDYKKEYQNYHSTPKQKKRRAERNSARRKMEREGKVRKGDGKDVHHKNGNTSDNSSKNLQVMSKSKNRAIKESALKINKGFVFRAKNNFDKVKSGLKYIVKDISGSIGNMVITVSQKGKDTPIKLKVRSIPEFYRNVMLSETHQNTLFKKIMMEYIEETPIKSLSETIKKVDGKYVVYPKKGGKRLGTHDTLSAAKKQLAAIEISK